MQIANIVAGFLLAAPLLKQVGMEEQIGRAEVWLNTWRGKIGIVTLVLGLLALLHRLSVISVPIPEFGASFPQALPAMAVGLLLASGVVEKFPVLNKLTVPLTPYRGLIGLIGVAVGIGSLLFGCFMPMFCGPRFF